MNLVSVPRAVGSRMPRIVGFLVSVFCLILLNGPSVKLLYPSDLVNAAGLMGLVYCGAYEQLIRKQAAIPMTVMWILILNSGLWACIFLSVIWGDAPTPEAVLLLRYVGAFIAVSAVCLFVRSEHLLMLAWLQVLWGGLLTALYTAGAITLDRSLGQHYLTLGVPLAAGFIAAMGMGLLVPRTIRFQRPLALTIGVFCLAGLVSLLGRAPVLLSFLVVVSSAMIYVWTERGVLKRGLMSAFFCVVFAIGASVAIEFFRGGWWERFGSLLLNLENEPRLEYYRTSVDLISAAPMGLGLGSYEERFGYYPHNIFLESAVTGGVLTVIPLFVIFSMLAAAWFGLLRKRSAIAPAAMIAVYMVLTWNVSFDLGTAYIPLGYAVATVAASRMAHGSTV